MPPMSAAPSAWKQRLMVVGLLFCFASVALASVREKSGTFDELFHITGGYSYWLKNDYRLHNTNGNLTQRWIALPLLAMNLNFPDTDSPIWYRPVYFGIAIGNQFFFHSQNDAIAMLWYGRMMVVVLGVSLGVVVYCWSRQLFGPRAGLLSLALFAFSPTMLAHSQLATSDIAAALGFTVSTWFMWRLLHSVSPGTLAASCLAVGLTAVVKFSAPLLAIVGLLMAVARLIRNRGWAIALGRRTWRMRGRLATLSLMAVLAVAHVLTAAAIIWACYGFRYTGFSEQAPGRDDFCDSWSIVMGMRGRLAASVIAYCRERELLPEAYLHGMAHTLKFSEERPAYLLGKCSKTGWWYYHPYCYLAKTTLSTHILSLLGIVALLQRAQPWFQKRWLWGWVWLYRLTPLAALLVVYWSAAMRSHLNLGVRHVLPVYPTMFILAGAAIYWTRQRPEDAQARNACPETRNKAQRSATLGDNPKIMAWLIAILLGLHVLNSLLTYPNYLAYFNPAVGGPTRGFKQLVDSNLDWGQELPGLARWLREHRNAGEDQPPFYLEYLGTSSPEYYGIKHTPLREFLEQNVSPSNVYPLRGGTYCMSATAVAAPNEFVTRWTRFHEQGLRQLAQAVQDTPEPERNGARWEKRRRMCAYLQFARLLAYAREREPDEHINYSLHIHHLTDYEVATAMHGPLKEMDE